MRRILTLLLAGVLTSCGSTASSTTTAPPTTTMPQLTTEAPTTTTGAPSTTAAVPTTTAVVPNLIVIEVAGSEVKGGGKLTLPVGVMATIRVVADVTDEVHLHGYDIQADVGPGVPAELVFETSIPGVFELELEGLGIQLAEIEVS